MIVFKDLTWQTRSDIPKSDWTGQARYIVDDNSDLARKIMSTPSWTPVEDENGELIDIEAVSVEDVPTVAEQIAALKAQLTATDYIAIKYAEGWLTAEEYEQTKAQRQTWREQINALESEGNDEPST